MQASEYGFSGISNSHFYQLSLYPSMFGTMMMISCCINLKCSGDTDSVVPVTGTRYSIRALKLQPVSKWYPWYDNGQVEEATKPKQSFSSLWS